MGRMIAADYFDCPVHQTVEDCLAITGGPQRGVHLQVRVVIRPGGKNRRAWLVVAKNAFPILLPKRIAPGNGRVGESEMMRARFTGNREATFSGGTQQLDTA